MNTTGVTVDFNSVLIAILTMTGTVIGIVRYMITKSEQRQSKYDEAIAKRQLETDIRQKEITDKYFEHLEKVGNQYAETNRMFAENIGKLAQVMDRHSEDLRKASEGIAEILKFTTTDKRVCLYNKDG